MIIGADLKVRYRGTNTSNGLWVRNVDTGIILADTHCLARERVSISLDDLGQGVYEVAYSGCSSDHSVLLMVRD